MEWGEEGYSVDSHSCCLHVNIQQAAVGIEKGEKETSTQWRAGFDHRG